MIDKNIVRSIVEKSIENTDLFIVDVKVSPKNEIVVEVDSPSALDIDTCIKINRDIEAELDRDVDDYELEVGSAGLTAPFKVRGQYEKNVGNKVEVLTKDGRKLSGVLEEVTENGFILGVEKKVRVEGKKRPEMRKENEEFAFDGVKSVKYLIEF